MKKYKSANIFFALVAVCYFICGAIYLFSDKSGMGGMFLCLGATFLCLSTVFGNKNKTENENNEDGENITETDKSDDNNE